MQGRGGQDVTEHVAGHHVPGQAHPEDSDVTAGTERDRVADLTRLAADRREHLARLAGQVAAKRSRIEAGEAEIGRLEGIVAASLARAAEAEKEFAALESTVADDEEWES